MDDVFIFVNIDPLFNFALHVLRALNDQERLEITNVQRAYLDDSIQSDDENDKFKFGGKNAANIKSSASAFGKTASAVFRMVMLHAVQIEERVWPVLGKHSNRRNKGSLQFEVLSPNGKPFKLLDNSDKRIARMYWSAYDRAFPHFLIESKVLESADNENTANFSNMMLIFRNNFSEVIEITTNADATMNLRPQDGTFTSFVHVLCIRREIKPIEGNEDGSFAMMKNYAKHVETKTTHIKDIEKLFEDEVDDLDVVQKKINDISLNAAQ